MDWRQEERKYTLWQKRRTHQHNRQMDWKKLPITFTEGCDNEVFNAWLELPELPPP